MEYSKIFHDLFEEIENEILAKKISLYHILHSLGLLTEYICNCINHMGNRKEDIDRYMREKQFLRPIAAFEWGDDYIKWDTVAQGRYDLYTDPSQALSLNKKRRLICLL